MIETQIKKIEEIAKKLDAGGNFDDMVKDFSEAAKLIQKAVTELKDADGKITEIIDGVEKAFVIA